MKKLKDFMLWSKQYYVLVMSYDGYHLHTHAIISITSGFAASARRTVASRLWLCIFNKIGKQSLRDCDLTTVASRL